MLRLELSHVSKGGCCDVLFVLMADVIVLYACWDIIGKSQWSLKLFVDTYCVSKLIKIKNTRDGTINEMENYTVVWI